MGNGVGNQCVGDQKPFERHHPEGGGQEPEFAVARSVHGTRGEDSEPDADCRHHENDDHGGGFTWMGHDVRPALVLEAVANRPVQDMTRTPK